MSPSHRALAAWHEDAAGRRIEHELTTLRDGSRRSFVTRWHEGGAWAVDASEREPGSFTGALEIPGLGKPLFVRCDVVELDGHVQVHVSARYNGVSRTWTIHAVEKRN